MDERNKVLLSKGNETEKLKKDGKANVYHVLRIDSLRTIRAKRYEKLTETPTDLPLEPVYSIPSYSHWAGFGNPYRGHYFYCQ
ncbi:hypothetical protein GCM10028806_11660 [Spirosoma terrae]